MLKYVNRTGFDISMINEVCDLLHCTMDYSNPSDLIWGSLVNKSEFTGHMREIVDEKVDLAIAGVIITYDTNLVIIH